MKIVVVGAGAIGSRVLAHVKADEIVVIDRDIVEEQNKQIYKNSDVGEPKAIAIQKYYDVKGIATELNEENTDLLNSDLVLDCVDNIGTRRIIHKYCMKHKIPWVHAAAFKDKYEVMPVLPNHPCFESLYSGKSDADVCTADNINVEIAKKVAKKQWNVAEQVIKGIAKPILYRNDLEIKVKKEKPNNSTVKLKKMCGSDMYQFHTKNNYKLEKGNNFWKFSDGRILIKAKTEKEALILFNSIK